MSETLKFTYYQNGHAHFFYLVVSVGTLAKIRNGERVNVSKVIDGEPQLFEVWKDHGRIQTIHPEYGHIWMLDGYR